MSRRTMLLLLLLLLLTYSIKPTSSSSSMDPDSFYGKYTFNRTPLKIPTSSTSAFVNHKKKRYAVRANITATTKAITQRVQHVLEEHPLEAVVVSAMAYLKVFHPEMAVVGEKHYGIADKEMKALAAVWFVWNVQAEWFTQAYAWLQGSWSWMSKSIWKLLHRVVMVCSSSSQAWRQGN